MLVRTDPGYGREIRWFHTRRDVGLRHCTPWRGRSPIIPLRGSQGEPSFLVGRAALDIPHASESDGLLAQHSTTPDGHAKQSAIPKRYAYVQYRHLSQSASCQSSLVNLVWSGELLAQRYVLEQPLLCAPVGAACSYRTPALLVPPLRLSKHESALCHWRGPCSSAVILAGGASGTRQPITLANNHPCICPPTTIRRALARVSCINRRELHIQTHTQTNNIMS